jgi:deoxyribonuclease (pyrimidine dimer)
MTRINCVEPSWLTDQHLVAEYRELPRVFALARPLKARERVDTYRMGRGHVLFFYGLTAWLAARQALLIAECLDRGFDIQHQQTPAVIPGLDGDWEPDVSDQRTNLVRLCSKLEQRPSWYRHRGQLVPPDFYLARLNRLEASEVRIESDLHCLDDRAGE